MFFLILVLGLFSFSVTLAGNRAGDPGIYYSFGGMSWEQALSISDSSLVTHEWASLHQGGGFSLGRWLPWMENWDAGAEFGTFFGISKIATQVSDQDIPSYRPTGVKVFGMRADLGARYEVVPGSFYFAITFPLILDFASWPVAPAGYTNLTDMSMILGITLKPEFRFDSFFLRPEVGSFNYSKVNYFALSLGRML